MLTFLDSYLHEFAASFLDPRKRMFIAYLLCAFVIALAYWVMVKRHAVSASIRALFSKRVWLSRSAKADYRLTLINQLFMQLVSPVLFTQLALATFLFHWFYAHFPSRPQWLADWSTLSVGFVFTATYFVLDDFARFYVHRLLHKWPCLWVFHKVHHSAQRLTPFTVFRTHPVEALIFSLRSVITQGVAIGALVFFLGDRADLVTVLGANVFVFFFNVIGANLRHSHVAIRYWRPLESVLISPAQHQIHHSIETRHWDKNFGVALSIWDRCFGSLHYSEARPPKAFGVRGCREHSLKALYWQPFKECAALSGRSVRARCAQLVTIFRHSKGSSVYESSHRSH